MSTIAGDLVNTTASTGTSINYAGQSQWVADGKLDVPVSGQTADYHLEDRIRYPIQDTESVQSLWANDAWTETDHNFTVDHEAHDSWVYNQTVNMPKYSDPIITNNPDGTFTSSVVQMGQDQATVVMRIQKGTGMFLEKGTTLGQDYTSVGRNWLFFHSLLSLVLIFNR